MVKNVGFGARETDQPATPKSVVCQLCDWGKAGTALSLPGGGDDGPASQAWGGHGELLHKTLSHGIASQGHTCSPAPGAYPTPLCAQEPHTAPDFCGCTLQSWGGVPPLLCTSTLLTKGRGMTCNVPATFLPPTHTQ